jgi:lactate dehydrogenase-like 2-hydroxyacid dehydrogenase
MSSAMRAFGPEKVILTPHIGWQRVESRQRLVDTVAFNIGAFFAGDRAGANLVSE